MRKLVPALLLMVGVVVAAPATVRAEEAPATVPGATTIDAKKAKEMFDAGAVFVDARKDSDWEAGRIPGAHHLELGSQLTKENLAKVAKPADKLVFYCNGVKCMVSPHAIAKVVEWGEWKNLYYLRDGLPGWKAAGFPTE